MCAAKVCSRQVEIFFIKAMGTAGENRNTSKRCNASPLRVLIVVASLDILGGQSVQATRLLEGLAAEPGIEVELLPVNPRLPGSLHHLQRIKYVRTVVTTLLYLVTLIVQVPRYDVVHVFSAAYFSFLLAPMPAVLVAKLFGKPVLLNYHSGEAEDHLNRSLLAQAVIRLADRVVVPSRFLVDVFAKFGISAQAVFNTVAPAHYEFRARRPLRPVLISNRNLEPMYNIGRTLRAFKLVQRKLPEARLIVVGDGSQGIPLRALARELEIKQVEFVGKVAPKQMPALYNRADVFINASLIDNMPLSIIEAFAAGLPVVTSDAGGIPYIVDDGRTGLVVRRDDEGALAQAVLRLFEEPELAQRLLSAAYTDCHRYTWEAVGGEWLRLYQDLANGQAMRDRASAETEQEGVIRER
jgi:glycosyltransferase involved in cell wall biosynthesis